MNYKEVVLPAGTFRMYEDSPNVWVQQLKPGEKNIAEKIVEAYGNGEISKSNK